MYKAFYGLSHNPFDKHLLKKQEHFQSKDFKEMTARLNFLKEVRGFGVFTSAPGMGKSFCLKNFADTLPNSNYVVKYLCLSTITVHEFYKLLADLLGIDVKGGKTRIFKDIQDRVYYLLKEKRMPLILIIDEAQYLKDGILHDLKLLMNREYDSLNCFAIILSGEERLATTLNKPIHEALKQRVTVNYNFQGLSDLEISDYIQYKLALAGAAPSIITTGAIATINSLAYGRPRLVDKLMVDALSIGAQMEKQAIDNEVIMAAANNQTF